MIGRSIHSASAETKQSTDAGWTERKPFVFLSNDDDSHYWQGFENWAELAAFIEQLKSAGIEAFGPQPQHLGTTVGK